MRRNLKTLPVTATLRDITTVIVGARQRLVPIVSGGSSVVGVVSRTDLINIFAQEPGRMNPTDRAPKSRNMGRTMRDRLPKDVLDILEKAGALGRSRQTPVYVVGGFVRDLLLKTPNHDIDLVVEGDGIGFARAFARRPRRPRARAQKIPHQRGHLPRSRRKGGACGRGHGPPRVL